MGEGEGRPLDGVPILIKDNIETKDRIATTAGSLALRDNVTGRDSPLVARLRDAGAIILGKTNLSEWAGMRSPNHIAGWSAAGGLTRNPYDPRRSACGSSAGSAAATAASFAAAAIGTETDGSIVCPASVNGVVGLKPTIGLIPRTFIVPIANTWDTPGPLARSVRDAALLLTIMAGSDPTDLATRDADHKKQDYVKALDAEALSGARIGVLNVKGEAHSEDDALFVHAIEVLQNAGAEIVELPIFSFDPAMGQDEFIATLSELHAGLDSYLSSLPTEMPVRTLGQLIEFDRAHSRDEMQYFRQEWFLAAEQAPGPEDPANQRARETAIGLAGTSGLDPLFAKYRLDALIAPTTGPAWIVRMGRGNEGADISSVKTLAALSGDPHLSVPMGMVNGLPVGLSFIGPKWSDARLLALGFAYEQRAKARVAPRLQ